MPDADAADTLPLPGEDLALIERAAREAGALALSFFRNKPKVWTKGHDSPVSEADVAVDNLLEARLKAARPDYGWLSEETADDLSRHSSRRNFCVDPIDGTRGFIAGDKAWSVCIAVIEAGKPLAGVVYCPPSDDMYCAVAGGGATLNGAPVAVSARRELAGAGVAGPRMMMRHPAFEDAGIEFARVVPSLALRLALVAGGSVDAAVVREGAHDWDLAAADLLVHEAGGRLTTLDGEPLTYNRPAIRHPALIAAPDGLHGALTEVVREATA